MTPDSWAELRLQVRDAFQADDAATLIPTARIAAAAVASPLGTSHPLGRRIALLVAAAVPLAAVLLVATTLTTHLRKDSPPAVVHGHVSADGHPAPIVSRLAGCARPGFDYAAPPTVAPVPERLTSDRSCDDGQLQAVPAGVQPSIDAATAFLKCSHCHDNGTHTISQELTYYSASTPATIPGGCEPGSNLPTPASCAASPWYHRTLVWLFVWKSECAVPSGGASFGRTPQPMPTPTGPCVWFSTVDATTGADGFLTTGW